MKIACDICEKVIDADNVKTENWLRVEADYLKLNFCKECSDKFWICLRKEQEKNDSRKCVFHEGEESWLNIVGTAITL